jgi:hypothetical protein
MIRKLGWWGMLWYDPEGEIEERVRRAKRYLLDKYDIVAGKCFVNPKTTDLDRVAGVLILRTVMVQPNYFWIGPGDTDKGR